MDGKAFRFAVQAVPEDGEQWLDRARRATQFGGEPGVRLLVRLISALLAAARGHHRQALEELAAAGRVQAGWVAVAVVAVAAVVLAVGQLRRVRTTYAITDRRLTIETGLLARELRQTRLERVQNVSCGQSLGERLLRVGIQ